MFTFSPVKDDSVAEERAVRALILLHGRRIQERLFANRADVRSPAIQAACPAVSRGAGGADRA